MYAHLGRALGSRGITALTEVIGTTSNPLVPNNGRSAIQKTGKERVRLTIAVDRGISA